MAKLGEVFPVIRNGASIKQKSGAGGFPITRIETISNRTVNRSKMGYAGIFDIEKYQDYVLQDGDILMSHINSEAHLGKVALYTKQGNEQIIHGMNLLMLRSNSKKLLPEYAKYYFESWSFLRQIQRITKKSVNQASFTVTALKEVEIPCVDIDAQKEIVKRLQNLEQLISLREQQLVKLDELIKARFVEMFGNPKDNKKEWNRVPLKKVAEVRGRVGWKGYKKEDLQESGPLVLGATHLTENGNIDLSSPVYLSRDKYEESPEIMLHRNDLVFTQRGNTIGKVGLVKEDIGEATINPCVLILRPTNIHPIYLDVYFIMDEVKKDMWRLNAGSAQPMITQKGISEYLLMLPPIELQNQFAAFVERVDKQKQTVQQSLEKLELMKKALMQEYFG